MMRIVDNVSPRPNTSALDMRTSMVAHNNRGRITNNEFTSVKNNLTNVDGHLPHLNDKLIFAADDGDTSHLQNR